MLKDIAMIAADTSRSLAYLHSLINNDLIPSKILFLRNSHSEAKPGQLKETEIIAGSIEKNGQWSEANFTFDTSLLQLIENFNIPYKILENNDINDPSVVSEIQRLEEKVLIYSGFGGILLRKPLFDTGKKFLHAHGGFLPDYKGSTTNYFSLLDDDSLGASTLFLNEQIDSGEVLHRKKFKLEKGRKEIDHVYDSAARCKVLVETLKNYESYGNWKIGEGSIDNSVGDTYFIIHPLLKHLAILDGE